jgi:hypothetical protein
MGPAENKLMPSMRELQDAAETTFIQARSAVESAASKTAIGDFGEALRLLSDAGHFIDMARRCVRLAYEAKARERKP